ncbi:MAG: response regulator [Candidatus Methanosuratincola sp.]|jgi:DNA-binding response OmpR family regulator|nr:response regulator [Candidatus Methanosuratincola sp.]
MSQSKKRILVVDDDEDIRETLKSLLTKKGYLVDTANDGAMAIRLSESTTYNLALLDMVLPDMEGTQLLVRLKPTMPRMRKIMVTGHASLDNAIRAVNMGADGYLIKPVSPPELLRMIEDQLKRQEDDERLTQEKITSYIETRIKMLEGSKGDRE